MSKLQLENVWNIMEKHDFNKENNIENIFLCLLCKKLLINAHITPCECRFCFDCISNYLNNEQQLCPGNSDECKIELIGLNENIAIDNAMNNKISKLLVNCPVKNCKFTDELRNIENHIRICNSQSSSCPYLNFGCKLYDKNNGKLIDHLQLEVENHTELLIDYINNLSNEIGTLKEIVVKLVEENKTMKFEMKLKEEKQMNCDREIDLLNKGLVELRNVDKYMRDNINEIKSDRETKEKSIRELKEKFQLQIIQIKNEFINKNDLRSNIDELKKKQSEMIDKTIEIKLLDLKINQNKLNYGEFIWKIDKINDKIKDSKNDINKTIYSDSFYSHRNGYKMCLSMDPNGDGDMRGTHLSVYFHLMKGEFDDILEWPFKHCVELSLIDQQTGLVHVSETSEYDNFPNDSDWNKPIDKMNHGFGSIDFISLDELLTKSNLTHNNQIFIKCSVII